MSFFRHAFRSLSNVSRPLLISGSSIFGVAAAIVFTNDNVFEIVNVRGESMAPTLSANYYETGECDEVLVKKYNPLHDLQRGDVVCFWSPFSADQYVIKRVVALEGDEVIIETKRVRAAMGKTLDSRGSSKVRRALEAWEQRAGNWEEEGRVELENDTGRLKKFKTRVPFGHIWVEGDNWRSTQDSNTYGPVCYLWRAANFRAPLMNCADIEKSCYRQGALRLLAAVKVRGEAMGEDSQQDSGPSWQTRGT